MRWILLVGVAAMAVGCAGRKRSIQDDLNHKPAPKLDFRVWAIDLEDEKYGNRKEISVHVDIRNIGRTTVILPTKAIGPVSIGNAAFMDVIFTEMGMQTTDGFRYAYSMADIAPVDLRPGECITLSYAFEKSEAPASVRVSYKIGKEFAERYGLWHGEFIAETVNLRK